MDAASWGTHMIFFSPPFLPLNFSPLWLIFLKYRHVTPTSHVFGLLKYLVSWRRTNMYFILYYIEYIIVMSLVCSGICNMLQNMYFSYIHSLKWWTIAMMCGACVVSIGSWKQYHHSCFGSTCNHWLLSIFWILEFLTCKECMISLLREQVSFVCNPQWNCLVCLFHVTIRQVNL